MKRARGRPRLRNDKQEQQIASLYKDGIPPRWLHQWFGYAHVDSIHKILTRLGVEKRRPGRPRQIA